MKFFYINFNIKYNKQAIIRKIIEIKKIKKIYRYFQ